MEATKQASLRSDERSTSSESPFNFTGTSVQLQRNTHVAIHEVVHEHSAWGVRKVWATLRRRGLRAGQKRVWAIMKADGPDHGTDRRT